MAIVPALTSKLHVYDLLFICSGFAVDRIVQSVFLTVPLTNILTILATHDESFDVLAACCTVSVAFAVAMLHSHTTATVCSS